MTMDMINEFINASIRGTLLGITIFFWCCGLAAIWKWVFGITKKFIHWLFPNFFKKKEVITEADNK